jgi:hypothetical protein
VSVVPGGALVVGLVECQPRREPGGLAGGGGKLGAALQPAGDEPQVRADGAA